MISKNKKKLLSAYIASLTMCSVANGEKYLSQKEKFRKDEEIIKLIEKNSSVVIDYESAYKGNAYIVEIQGDAWNKLIERYIPIRNSKTYSGHAGNGRKFIRKSDGKTVMVKCIPNELVGMTTDHVQINSIKKEVEFFNKLKNYKYHPGIVNCYDVFSDNNVTYIVQDWLEGTTIGELPQEFKDQSFAWKKRFIYKVIKKMANIIEFTEKQMGVYNKDMNSGSWMIVPKYPNEINVAEQYKDFDLYLVDWEQWYDCNDNKNPKNDDENNPHFILYKYDSYFFRNCLWMARQLGISKYNSEFWENQKDFGYQDFNKLFKDFFTKCARDCEGYDHDYRQIKKYYLKKTNEYFTLDEDVKPIYFQNYEEVIAFCDAKIKEAETEMKISK